MNEWTVHSISTLHKYNHTYVLLSLPSQGFLDTTGKNRWKKSDAELGSAVSCSDYSLPSGQITLWRIPNFHWANLIIAVCLPFRGPFCAFFRTGIDLWWFSAMLCHAFFLRMLNDTNSDLLTRINMVKNGGFCGTERLLPHNVKCHTLRFFSL